MPGGGVCRREELGKPRGHECARDQVFEKQASEVAVHRMARHGDRWPGEARGGCGDAAPTSLHPEGAESYPGRGTCAQACGPSSCTLRKVLGTSSPGCRCMTGHGLWASPTAKGNGGTVESSGFSQ